MDHPEITVRIAAADSRTDEVDLDDLNLLCQRLSKTLKATEKAASRRGRSKLDYRLTGLEHGSAALVIQPRGEAALAEETTSLFNSTVDALEVGGLLDPRLDRSAVEAYGKLGDMSGVSLSISGRNITANYLATAAAWLRRTIATEGSVRGLVKRLDLRGRRLKFGLYPIGSKKAVECYFDSSFMEAVREATNRTATVYGRLTYWGSDPSPAEAEVERIELLDPTQNVPSFASLRGTLSSKATHGLSTVDFVRSLRDDD